MRWRPGDEILWCYRREAIPGRVVQDDDECLAVWIAPGTKYLGSVPVDGRGLRERPVEERFTCERSFALLEWFGAGVLRVAFHGDAHSSWLFRRLDDHAAFWGWYGNLEDPLRRSHLGVHTRDHVLDVWVDAEGNVGWKDEDELVAAIACGRYTEEEGVAIRAHGEEVFAAMQRGDRPYDGSWLDWRPDSSWTTPSLSDDLRGYVGKASHDLFPA